MEYDQANYAREDTHEPLLSEKDETTVAVGGDDAPLPDSTP